MAPVPSKFYNQFIVEFEKQVAKKQIEIEKINRLQGVYTLIKEMIEKENLPHDGSLIINEYGIRFDAPSLPDDTISMYMDIFDRIQNSLINAKYIRIPYYKHNHEYETTYCQRGWSLIGNLSGMTVCISFTIPTSGLR